MTRTLRLLSVAAVFVLAACPKPTPPALPDVALGDTTVGISVSKEIHATGGAAPLTYSATGVPAGMTFDAGVLSGAPTASGDFTLSVTVTDAENQTATKGYAFKVYAAPVFTATGIPDAIVGASYSVQFAMTGGKAPFLYVATALDLPAQLTFAAATGTLAGVPAAPGIFSISLQVTDSNGASVSQTFSGQILEQLRIVTTSLPQGMVGTAYSTFVQALGGKAPIAFSVLSGMLPPGLSIDPSTGQLSGTPTAAGSFTFTVLVTDASSRTTTMTFTVKVFTGTPLQITTSTLADGVAGDAYSETLAAAGGRTPYTWTATAGSLPAGLTLSTSGALTGTPTAAGTSSVAVTVTDPDGQSASATLTLIVYARLAVGSEALSDGYAGDGYAFNFSVTGGRTPYVWSVLSGALPAGLTLTSGGALAGTPTVAGTFAFTVQVADGSAQTALRSITLSVLSPLAVGNAALADGSVGAAYSETLFANGGKAPYAFAVAGALPAGITASGAVLAGTPTTAGTSTFTLTVTDGNGKTASKNLSIRIWAGLAVTTGSLPDGYISVAYAQTLTAVGGTSPYSWSLTGTLPPGIALNGDQLIGTPTASGTFSFSVTVTDSASGSNTKALAIVIAPALTLTTAALADGYRASGYVDSLTGSGGKPPYTYGSTGPLPPGVTLGTDGLFGGSPTAAGTYAFTAQLTDQNGTSANKAMQIVVYEPPSLADATFRVGTQGQSYSQALPGSGGKAPLSYSVTAGSLPAGLSVAGANISGTPTTAETQTFTAQVSDQNGRTASKAYSITINPPVQVSTTSLPDGYPTIPYSQALAATGGLAPYTWSLTAGSLPAGLTLGASTIGGTPTSTGTSSFTVQATDSNGATATATLTITIVPALAVTTTSVPDTYVGDTYSATLAATGGLAPYTWDLASGSLPPGIALASGALSGTATVAGTSSFTVRATDQNSTAATQALSITVSSLPSILTTSLPDVFVGVAYSATLAATGGRLPYTWSVSSGALPAGLTLNGTTGLIDGTPTGGSGTFSFSVTVSDAGGKTAVQALTLTVFDDPIITTTGPLPIAYGTDSYSQTFTATGGALPLTWSLTAGALPAGLTLLPTGEIIGVVSDTVGNNFSNDFTVTVTDANSRSASASFSILSFRLPQLTTASVDTATEGITYGHAPGTPVQVAADLGLPPYTFSASGLPPGLAMSSSGVISGIPGQGSAGTYTASVTLTDSNGRAPVRTLPMVVVAAAPISGGGWYSVEPEGSPVTDALTVFAIDSVGRPLSGIGVRIQKNGADFAPVKEALTDAGGKAFFSGLGLDGTTDTLSLTGNGLGYENASVVSVNAALVTLSMASVPNPRPREDSPLLYDAALGKLLLFGGTDTDPDLGIPAFSYLGCVTDVARLDDANAAGWSELVPSGMAGGPRQLMNRQAAALAGGTEVFFGGRDCRDWNSVGETWRFSSATGTWIQVLPASSPNPRYGGAMVAEAGGNTALLFGGNDGVYSSDLWRYSLPLNSWTPLAPGGGPPSGREAMGYAMRTATGDFWICGGSAWGTDVADCWSYNAGTNLWTSQPPLPQPRSQLAMAYDPVYDTLYVFGGSSGGVARSDLLALPPGAPAWMMLTPDGQAGAPSRRRAPQMAYEPAAGELVVFGGISDALTYPTAIGDTWTFHRTNGWAQRNAVPAPATLTVSGTITGGYPTGTGYAYLQIGTTAGRVFSKTIYLSNGSGQYLISGIPANSTVAVQAVARAPASAGLPGNVYSFHSATGIGPLTGNATHDIAFPGQMPTVTSTFTLLRPANWSSPGYLGATPRVRPAGYGSLRSGLFSVIDAAAGMYQLNHYTLPGAPNTAAFSGQNDAPSACEYNSRYLTDFTPGSLGTFQLPQGQRGMTPGQNPCTPEGTGFSDALAENTGATPVALAVGAFLGNDLALDAAIADSTSNTVTLYQGDGVILSQWGYDTWVNTGSLPVGPMPTGVAVADLVGDSNADLAVVTRVDNALRIYAGTGNGFSLVPDTYTLNLFQPIALAAADVTGDGRPDLVVLNNNGTVVTYMNQGPALPFTQSGAVTLGGTVTAMALGDYSGDTVADLAVTVTSPTPQVVLRQASAATGAFSIPGPVLTPSANPASVTFGDYSGDGRPDVVVGHVPGTLVLSFQNLDGGSFAAPEALFATGDVPAIGLRDLNADGRDDLVLATAATQRLAVYERGAGTWTLSESKPNWPGVKDLEIADLNGDGSPDVLTANSGNSTFSTFIGRRPLPTAADPQFALDAPADAKLAYVYRGTYQETYEWTMKAPATGGPMTFVFPPPSTLAPSRPLPSGQKAHWDPNFYLYDAAAPFNYHDSRTHGGYYGYTGTQTYGYVRQ